MNCDVPVNVNSDGAYRYAIRRGRVISWCCGEQCAIVLRVKRLQQRHCPVCRQVIERTDPTGRPPSFCGDKCRRQRERDLDRAVRALARGTVPDRPVGFGGATEWLDRIDTELADAEQLLAHWTGDGPTTPTGTVSPDARAGLVQRVNVLHRLRGMANQAVGEENRQALIERRQEQARQIAEDEHARDNAWRDELLNSKETLS
ncbi:hypothetical protein SAMN05216266_11010 [Amycolatopsis marina]|uniref:Uncharacterized protein n=2 Tax=Amycolatopsis marina TaxID=490629 RepID=A0A1I1ANT7_9PSEU|nr:hypothetical protein SAMN05216266_11010 [Amycolatopsis marina]